MKLQDLGTPLRYEQAFKVLENQAGTSINFDKLTISKARGMLKKVDTLLSECRSRPHFHTSERSRNYLQLLMMEQALSSYVEEQMGAVLNDPKAKQVMDKVQRGQTLTPDEQQTVNKIALSKQDQVNEKYMGFSKLEKEIAKRGDVRDPGAVAASIGRKKYGKEKFQKAAAAGRKLGESRLTESEIQQAQVVLAAQDMIDRLQGMLEDISEMQFKDLPALTDSIKNDMGTSQAEQFQSGATAALTQLLAAMQAGKTAMESAQGALTGTAPVVPGQDQDTGMPADMDADMDTDVTGTDDEEDLDLSLDANIDDTETLGRERR